MTATRYLLILMLLAGLLGPGIALAADEPAPQGDGQTTESGKAAPAEDEEPECD